MTSSQTGISAPQSSAGHGSAEHSSAGREAARMEAAKIRLTIEYCEIGNYVKAARRLAAQIGEELRDCVFDLELIPSHGGVFEVAVDGRILFSKKATNRLPDWDEISYHVNAARIAARAYLVATP